MESLAALYTRATTSQQPLLAATLSGTVDVLALVVIVKVINSQDWVLAGIWIFGRAVGSYCGTKVNFKKSAPNSTK